MKIKNKPAQEFKGIAVSPGMALGKVVVFGSASVKFPKFWIHNGEVAREVTRFHKALTDLKTQLDRLISKLCKIQGREPIGILESHILFLKDELLIKNTVSCIEDDQINAEWAVSKTVTEIEQAFSKIDHTYFRERKYDIHFLEKALLRTLMGEAHELFDKVPRGSIVVAHDLSPAETLHLIRYKIHGLVTEVGGLNSHTAILTRSLQIPAIAGIEGITKCVNEQDKMLLDADKGRVLLNPKQNELIKFEKICEKQKELKQNMRKESQLEAITTDGHRIELLANMEFVDEMEFIRNYGAEGIGLYRTEFLFLDRKIPPTVKEQVEIYRKILKKMAPHEVTIRTVDLGADKISFNHSYPEQANPALGLRAIRLSMRESELFNNQLEALFQAAPAGNLKICFPMISTVEELRQVKKIVAKIRPAHQVPLGIMIETPSALMELDLLATEADFFSVGTNDLIQYLLAVDRTNELVSFLYNPLHPSVIRALKQIVDMSSLYGKELTLCGEIAGDPFYLLLLMALGFKRLSMNEASIPKVKQILRKTSMKEAQALLKEVLTHTSYKENKRLIQQRMHELFPEYF